MSVLDNILIRDLVESPTTINTDYTFDTVNIMNREDEFSFQLNYNNGSSVDMIISLEVSNDGVNFVVVTDSNQTITEDSGTHIYDVAASGTNYARVTITVAGGSIDVTRLLYMGKRRH